MILFITFMGLLLNLLAGGLIKELGFSNYFFSITATGFYLHYLFTHYTVRGVILTYIIWFFALLTVVACLSKATEGKLNFIGVLAVIDCVCTLIALIMACVFMPRVGIFY